jgi:hypothetical protein
MNNISKSAITVIVVLVLFASIQTASAQPFSTNIKYKGISADAYWQSEQNGIYTDVYVFASEYSTQEKSEKYNGSGAYVGIYQYTIGNEVCQEWEGGTICWNEYIPLKSFFGYTGSAPSTFQNSGRLGSATLDTTLNGYDYMTDSAKSVTINANWIGDGEYSTGNGHYNYRSGSYSYSGHYVGTDRAAIATATISGDMTLDLGSSSYGYLHNTKAGYAYVTNY